MVWMLYVDIPIKHMKQGHNTLPFRIYMLYEAKHIYSTS